MVIAYREHPVLGPLLCSVFGGDEPYEEHQETEIDMVEQLASDVTADGGDGL